MAAYRVNSSGEFLVDATGAYLIDAALDGTEGDPTGGSSPFVDPRPAANSLVTISAVVDFGCGTGRGSIQSERRTAHERRLDEMN